MFVSIKSNRRLLQFALYTHTQTYKSEDYTAVHASTYRSICPVSFEDKEIHWLYISNHMNHESNDHCILAECIYHDHADMPKNSNS